MKNWIYLRFLQKKMIHRIVKMEFLPEKSDEFAGFVKTIVDKIASSEGCEKVEILRDVDNPNIFFTYSFWKTQADLENYRKSELFKDVWSKTRKMFAKKAEAWSTEIVETR